MAPIKNGRVLYNEITTGFPIPGKNTVYDTSQTIDLGTVPFNGAGPVDATVVQLAKTDELRVITSTGSNSKVDFVKSLGAYVVFNYKETNTRELLEKEGPINLYWDQVGGEITDAVLENASGVTIIVCASISGYNNPAPILYRHNLIFERDATIYGLGVLTIQAPYHPRRLLRVESSNVQKGLNEGKAVIVVAKDL
ncbi:hypothetical protein EUX98_g5286 [Antrodiella citrinella]|uniref:Alcohol dehydrogenase-like C-terminal domain-containing protein n=1 Tax=Antrodiella citrinella TaxID=2447956 RepID=A0A4S4MTT4_9APHY|nr:hypothetical protein EUX98_g5286 [Antrodiella citrinella]